eukprot:Lankesteria_metandrocarpae@DN1138_c0_g1_i1.p1
MKEKSLLSFFQGKSGPLEGTPTHSTTSANNQQESITTSANTGEVSKQSLPSADTCIAFKGRQCSPSSGTGLPAGTLKIQTSTTSDFENCSGERKSVESSAVVKRECTTAAAAAAEEGTVPKKRRRIQSLLMEDVKDNVHGTVSVKSSGRVGLTDENNAVRENNKTLPADNVVAQEDDAQHDSAATDFDKDSDCKEASAQCDHEDLVSDEDGSHCSDGEQTREGAKRVWADSKAGKMLLSSLQPKKTVSVVQNKSLFGLGNSSKSSNVSEPGFDPSTLDGDTLRHKVRGKLPVASSSAAKTNNSLLFALLVESLDSIERLKGSGTGSKKLQAVILANTFRILLYHSPTDLVPAVYICMNKTAPDYANVELGVGDAMLVKAVTETYGRSIESIRKELAELEDLGAVAANSKCSVNTLFQPNPLSISHVFSELKSLPDVSGASSIAKKRDKIKKLLVAASGNEPKFIIRFLQGNMRIGAQKASVFQAIAFAFTLSPRRKRLFISSSGSDGLAKEDCALVDEVPDFVADVRSDSSISLANLDEALQKMESSIRTAFSAMPDIEKIINHLLQGANPDDLERVCVVTPGIPLEPMLAKPTKGLKEVFARFSNCRFTCEFKYDGERAQVHKLPSGHVKVFSRNLEDMTEKYPDIVLTARTALGGMRTAILDCEAVAFDTVNLKILPFQVLQGRKRKAVKTEQITVQVCLFAFDCILLNDEPLTMRPLIERRALLQEHFVVEAGKSALASYTNMTSLENVDSFLQEAMDAACEGIMVKTLDVNASYEPSRRSLNWLKVKKDYIDGLGDSVDLVPIGAFQGTGKRAKTWGTYLLSVYNPQKGNYQTVCKAATGFTDEDLQQHYDFYQDYVLPRKPSEYEVNDRLTPDVWLSAVQVWECKAADLSISPVHTAGMDDENPKGIGLRFPRFLRIRGDKNPQQATTHKQIHQMYKDQFESTAHTVQVAEEEDEQDDS